MSKCRNISHFRFESSSTKHDPAKLRNILSDLGIFLYGGWEISLFVVWTSREMIRARKRVKRGWRGANWKRAVKMASLAKDDIDIFISRFHVCRACLRFFGMVEIFWMRFKNCARANWVTNFSNLESSCLIKSI